MCVEQHNCQLSIKSVVFFQHAVFFLAWLVAYVIPDVPSRVKQLMLRELYLSKEARYAAAFSTIHSENEPTDATTLRHREGVNP